MGGKRLRKCSGTARWAYAYFLLLANGYGRIELDYEALAEHFVSFRGEAPSASHIQSHFAEYQEHHLVFVYCFGGRTWGQFDTKRSNLKHHKTAVDRRSPHPPEAGYQSWLKEQHPEDWGLYHWSSAPETIEGEQPPSHQPLIKSYEKLQEVSKTYEDFVAGLGVGVGVGLGVGGGNGKELKTKPSKPSARKARGQLEPTDPRWHHCIEILHRYWDRWAKAKIRFELWFDAPGGKQLKNILQRHKVMTVEEFTKCVANRARSPGTKHEEPFYLWGGHILEWVGGPKGVNDTGNSKADQRATDVRQSTGRVFDAARASLDNPPGRLQEQVVGSGAAAVDSGAEPGRGKILNAGNSSRDRRDGEKPAAVRDSGS